MEKVSIESPKQGIFCSLPKSHEFHARVKNKSYNHEAEAPILPTFDVKSQLIERL